MKKEVFKHQKHLSVTLEHLIALLFPLGEFDQIFQDKEHFIERIEARSQWVKVDELVIPHITTVLPTIDVADGMEEWTTRSKSLFLMEIQNPIKINLATTTFPIKSHKPILDNISPAVR